MHALWRASGDGTSLVSAAGSFNSPGSVEPCRLLLVSRSQTRRRPDLSGPRNLPAVAHLASPGRNSGGELGGRHLLHRTPDASAGPGNEHAGHRFAGLASGDVDNAAVLLQPVMCLLLARTPAVGPVAEAAAGQVLAKECARVAAGAPWKRLEESRRSALPLRAHVETFGCGPDVVAPAAGLPERDRRRAAFCASAESAYCCGGVASRCSLPRGQLI